MGCEAISRKHLEAQGPQSHQEPELVQSMEIPQHDILLNLRTASQLSFLIHRSPGAFGEAKGRRAKILT